VFLQEEQQAVSSSVHSGVTRPAKRNAARASDALSQPPVAPMPLQAEHEALQEQQAVPSRFCTGDVFMQKGEMKRVTRTAPMATVSRGAEVLELEDNFPLSSGNDVFLHVEMKRATHTAPLATVGKVPQKGRPGFDAVLEPSGLCVINIVSGSSVVDTDLILGDIITSINEDLISGMTIEEAWPLLWGEMNSSVELMITRLVDGIKRRLVIDVVRDHNPSSEVPKPPKSNSSTGMIATKAITKSATLKSSAPRNSAPRNSAPVVPAAPSQGSKINSGGNITKLIFFLIMIHAIYFFSGTGNSN
jgi:hypothetical protein